MINLRSVTNAKFKSFATLLIFLIVVGSEASASCQLQEAAEVRFVAHIGDGDTLQLRDGTHVRLIGINTPELGYRDKPSEPLAVKARNLLRARLHSKRIFLAYDRDRRDRHGRVLAHVFDEQRANVAAWLIRQGLGFAISIPPNLRYRLCYRAAAAAAKAAKRGVWTHRYFKVVEAESLKRSGFKRVHGCIQRIHSYRNKTYLYLSKRFRLLLFANNRHYFEAASIAFKKGLCLRTAGWVYNSRSYRTMNLLHPDAIEAIN